MISKKDIEKFFEDYFAEEFGIKFDKNLKVKDIGTFDSLEILNLSMNFKDKLKHTIKKEDFAGDKTFSEIIDSIFTNLSQKLC